MLEKKRIGFEDLAWLNAIDDKSITANIEKRFRAKEIHCSIGHNILVVTNPFERIEHLYSEETLEKYRGASSTDNPPHIYQLAENMFSSLTTLGINQTVILNGESGAGKTMNANFIIDYIQKSTFQGSSPRLQTIKKIIRSSVGLLEAMGNAKTIRNNNSSRFGKLLEIRFNAANEISGSHITPFMLETARITNVTENNRSFHIFYQLIAVNNQYTEGLGMEDVSHFKYLRDGLTIADNINDVEGFEETLTALKDINISDEDIKSFFQIIAGVAHLGNIEFEAISDSESRVANRDALQWTASLLGFSMENLEKALTSLEMSMMKETVIKSFNKHQANTARDSLAKLIYRENFHYIITKINEAMTGEGTHHINILDIFGFEIFNQNYLEQLCINYANETLQNIFVNFTIKKEKQIYESEGIKWENVSYKDNLDIVNMIQDKMMPRLGDTCAKIHGMKEGADSSYLMEISNINSEFLQVGSDRLTIKHFTVPVTYSIEGIVEKNREAVSNDIQTLINSSSNKFLLRGLRTALESIKKLGKKAFVSERIVKDMKLLKVHFEGTEMHYVRCLKSTNTLKPNNFEEKLMAQQVRDLGITASARLNRSDVKKSEIKTADKRQLAERIVKVISNDSNEYACGKTRIFIKSPEIYEKLLDAKINAINRAVVKVQEELKKLNLKSDSENENAQLASVVKKDRNRYSFEVPELYKCYVGIENTKLEPLLKRKEKVKFSFMIRKYTRSYKPEKCSYMWVLITDKNILLCGTEVDPNNKDSKQESVTYQYKLIMRFTTSQIESIEASSFSDRFCILKFAQETNIHPIFFHTTHLTQLLYGLNVSHDLGSKIRFVETTSYKLKSLKGFKGSVANAIGGTERSVKFIRGEAGQLESGILKPVSKGVHVTASGKETINSNKSPDLIRIRKNRQVKFANTADTKYEKMILSPNKPAQAKASANHVAPQPMSRPKPPPAPISPPKQKVRAIADYNPRESDELSFKMYQIFEVESLDPNGWYLIRDERTGDIKYAPANHFETIDD